MSNNMEIFEEHSGYNDQRIVKRKRSKRLRPSSSASSSGGGDFICTSLVIHSSPASASTEEAEDMAANCLILLARGGSQSPEPDQTKSSPDNIKFTSRKFTEISTDGAGAYLYECKTCTRTFPSFQALGGHRASHKKPKTTSFDADRKKSPPIAAQISPNRNIENKSKIHECSICGSEFGSGQALGGHMRRHRTKVRDDIDSTSFQDEVNNKRNVLALDLDLNLPAPPEDDQFREMDRFSSANQQPRLVFSAAALVDCHY